MPLHKLGSPTDLKWVREHDESKIFIAMPHKWCKSQNSMLELVKLIPAAAETAVIRCNLFPWFSMSEEKHISIFLACHWFDGNWLCAVTASVHSGKQLLRARVLFRAFPLWPSAITWPRSIDIWMDTNLTSPKITDDDD